MTDSFTPELAAELSPATRTALLNMVERFEDVANLIDNVSKGLAVLNRLDDLRRAEIAELRLTVRLLAQAQGIETKGEPLVELIRSYSEPAPASIAAPAPFAESTTDDLLSQLTFTRSNLASARDRGDSASAITYRNIANQLAAEIARRAEASGEALEQHEPTVGTITPQELIAYHAHMQALRADQAYAQGERPTVTVGLGEGLQLRLEADPSGDHDPIPWAATLYDDGDRVWSVWRGTADESVTGALETIERIENGEEV